MSPQNGSSALEERITSGSTAQAPAAPVPRSIMTGEKSMAAESRIVP